MTMTRRTLLASTSAALLGSALSGLGTRPARAQSPQKLNILSHRIHKIVSTGTQGGDITQPWMDQHKVGIEWLTFDQGPLRERLFREASLRETTIDIGFVLNTQLTPSTAEMFEPLDDYQKSDPIEEFADIFPGMLAGMRIRGRQMAIPFRHTTSGLHYNSELFAERGLAGPPETIEEFVEHARKLTYTRSDGTPVVGLVLPGVSYPNVVDLARAWNGDFITPDYKVVANQPPMVRAVTILRELFQAGAFPRNFATIQTEDVNTWMQTGRAAMSVVGMSRTNIYNDPKRSKFPGKFLVAPLPISKEFKDKFDVAPAKVEFWSMAIPKNSQHKKLAWSLIRQMLSKDSTLKAALNGNGPVRNGTYDIPAFASKLAYAKEERRVLKVARVPMPPFDNDQRAGDIFKEEVEGAVLGMKPVQKALDDVTSRVQALLKS
jgi:multiple sugar transport system substrate-binding protein